MHIHVSHFESKRSVPDVPRENWLAWKVAAAADISQDPGAPTRILGEGFYDPLRFKQTPLGRPPKDWARAYVVHVPTDDPATDLGVGGLGLLRLRPCRQKLPSVDRGSIQQSRLLGWLLVEYTYVCELYNFSV
jgi:hypothetical protein